MFVYKDGLVGHFTDIFKNTSFSTNGPSDEFLAEHGAYKVSVFLPHDRVTEKLVQCDPYILGEYAYTVKVEPKTQAEIDDAAMVSAHKIRAERAALLAASDWTQLSDSPVDKVEWAVYRQKLRDIPSQAGFPSVVEWPEVPVKPGTPVLPEPAIEA